MATTLAARKFILGEPMKPATAGAAGERAGLAVEVVAELQHLRRLAQLALALGLGRPGEAQRKTMLSRTVMGG